MSSYDKLLKEKETLQLEYLDFKRQVELTTEGSATKEVRMLKSMVKNLEEELTTSRVKYQHSNSRKNQEIQRLTAEVILSEFIKQLMKSFCR